MCYPFVFGLFEFNQSPSIFSTLPSHCLYNPPFMTGRKQNFKTVQSSIDLFSENQISILFSFHYHHYRRHPFVTPNSVLIVPWGTKYQIWFDQDLFSRKKVILTTLLLSTFYELTTFNKVIYISRIFFLFFSGMIQNSWRSWFAGQSLTTSKFNVEFITWWKESKTDCTTQKEAKPKSVIVGKSLES